MKILKQSLSEKVAIGIQGHSREEVERKFNSFFNWKATDGEFHWMNEGYGNSLDGNYFGFFWSTEEKLQTYLRGASLNFTIINQSFNHKGKKGGIDNLARQIAEEWRASWVEESFLPQTSSISEAYKMVEFAS